MQTLDLLINGSGPKDHGIYKVYNKSTLIFIICFLIFALEKKKKGITFLNSAPFPKKKLCTF